ncbi:peroxiredoxin family protein [Natronolimnohabitans innermongolicus]|uniref:Alkyl hydroperoxide reductase/ thiol specific antioxidant/ Mal allergen n=1 Tax=Natronolimnohabitans innermongolicus JCM 12255 TaxID=1227499 RepID=L9X0T1_9EURY|nr:redoxin domain-containing protein [Natronolimnohabitans innermongolicus]ELY55031.1 alkyl hydroperoxide reductase/ thiol specific antioxidant/ Mal allergen [Natronolimnohabitans innermongolicus JCM 12255]
MSGETRASEVTLPNVGPGPDPLTLGELIDPVAPADPTTTEDAEPAHDAVLLLLHRDHHAGQCRRQVRAVADRYDEFRERGCQVVSVVPEPRERVGEWQDRYDLPFPLCADPDATAGEAFEQPVRLGPIGRHFDLIGRMPTAIVLAVDEDGDLSVVDAHRGRSNMDRPEIDDLLTAVDRHT